ncbi:hypothetical protein BBO99_00001962 [Phytophthora kernoviae]|uniref:Uncharacterized protein n=2 Tax=Phytophthora kernoviae TaxID=325452 RepID=A0A421GXY7_9STRA|nr:hypothetical protein G195_002511 [Phytophthora kernoviae 00238/432]KAG2530155.1 hypothetical protein JM16_001643 [Phytophthora kernoviae]KAG2530304.1 hypothetical protein JM18_001813 [Phytophthora kernoviae]RLN20235.1 hypothetical protein BBI17_001988 [Phytophthora kernoviae]RLN83569.1 hypothetical protein BBO99_00001962 [Phytophthora kernoviae]
MPLYRRGPCFMLSSPNAAALEAGGLPQFYGPPDDLARSLELDMRLFSAYLLVAESLATFVGYRIAQHCLRGCHLSFLSASQRMWIGVFYCWFKIKLIDYAFHGSVYYTMSLLIMVVYFVYAMLAFGFHFGPLQFLFFDCIPRNKMTQSLIYKTALLCKEVSKRVEFYVLQQLICRPPLETRDRDAMTSSPIASHPLERRHATSSSKVSFSRVTSFFGREVDVNIELWNSSMCQQWAVTLSGTGRSNASRIRDNREDLVMATTDVFECRFLFVMQQDGLLLGLFMTNPTATLMVKFRDGQAVPFELMLRYQCSSRSALPNTQPLFMYAESPRLVGRASPAQKNAVYRLLCQLNAAHGHTVDVPLHALRCKNFVDAGVGQVVKKKARNTGSFTGLDAF